MITFFFTFIKYCLKKEFDKIADRKFLKQLLSQFLKLENSSSKSIYMCSLLFVFLGLSQGKVTDIESILEVLMESAKKY